MSTVSFYTIKRMTIAQLGVECSMYGFETRMVIGIIPSVPTGTNLTNYYVDFSPVYAYHVGGEGWRYEAVDLTDHSNPNAGNIQLYFKINSTGVVTIVNSERVTTSTTVLVLVGK